MKTAIKRALTAAAGGGIALAPVLLPGTASAAGRPATVYVSLTAHSGARDTSCQSAGYPGINEAIGAVAAGGTVVVCRDTYKQTATVDRPLTLLGRTGAVIDASGLAHGIVVRASDVTVRGLTVENANEAGILISGQHPTIAFDTSGNNAVGIQMDGAPQADVNHNTLTGNAVHGIALGQSPGSHIEHNTATGNGLDGIVVATASPGSYVEHNVANGNVEGITIFGSSWVHVEHNSAEHNDAQNFALTDLLGTTSHNDISNNISAYSKNGDGVLISSFTGASNGGIYDNTVRGNLIKGNRGSGVAIEGVLAPGPVSGNVVEGNRILGNGLPGVTVLQANSSVDMNSTVVTRNRIGTNNLTPDTTRVPVGETTGIFVSSVTPLSIEVSQNTIHSNHYGIWMSHLAEASGLDTNHFGNVTVPMFTEP